ncbi:MAG: MoxR family ATPase [Spirochaetaceae bacterium]|nr:MoxR family ATPase [Spirochaetaceae bacterium]
MTDTPLSADDLIRAKDLVDKYRRAMAQRIVGQEDMLDGLLTALIAGGHILLEGAPGLAKTLAVKRLAAITGLEFKRIQFTADLLPADLTGTMIWEPDKSVFSVRKGPVFTNIVLADEINRAPAKVQSALLEAMEEYQVTIGEQTWPLCDPFFVLATQNPIEHEGTYPLPEAQLDRFLLKLKIDYPGAEDELNIVRLNQTDWNQKCETAARTQTSAGMETVLGTDSITALRTAAARVHVDEQIERYIVSIVAATRPARDKAGRSVLAGGGKKPFYAGADAAAFAMPKAQSEGIYRYISFGASPRASIALHNCAKIKALFAGNTFVRPEDVKTAAFPVLRHRLSLSYEAEADGLDADAVITRILASVPAP